MSHLLAWFLSPAVMWGFVAGLSAVTQEYMYRVNGSWVSQLHVIVPLQLLISYAIYRLVTIPNTSLIDAFVVFAFSTTAMRVFVTIVLLGDTVKFGTWVALGLLVLARIAQTHWGR